MREFTIGRLHGRFVVSWFEDGKRRRYRLAAFNAKEAEAEARDVILRETLPVGTTTVRTIWEAYREDTKGRRISEHMGHSGKAVLPHFGELRPDQVSVDDCRVYTAKRRLQGRADGTIHTELGHLRTCLKWAQGMRLIPMAPKIERPAQPAPVDRFLDRSQVERLIAADAAPHVRLAILLMLTTAGRVSAVLELTWDRVNLDRGQINLRTDDTGPRKGRAIVPINSTLRAALATAREAAMTEFVVEYAGGPVLSIKRGFASAVANAGLPHITPHDLRRTAARLMAEAGVPMSEIAQYLGHSNTTITERVYGRFSPEHLRKAADVLDFAVVRKVR